VSTDNDYELLNHLKNDTMVETIATIQSTFLWDGICRGRFLSFPHLALHGDAQTSHIMRVLERWLCDKLMQPQLGDRLPILEESIPDSCRSIMATMHQGMSTPFFFYHPSMFIMKLYNNMHSPTHFF
jgi:hypothetical protein